MNALLARATTTTVQQLKKMIMPSTSSTKRSRRRQRWLVSIAAIPQIVLLSANILRDIPICDGFSPALPSSPLPSSFVTTSISASAARSLTINGRLPHSTLTQKSEIRLNYQQRKSNTNLQSTSSANASWGSSFSMPSFAPARRERIAFELKTFLRVLLPAVISGVVAFATLPALCSRVTDFVTLTTIPEKLPMLNDVVTSFLSLVSLLYSILVGQVFGFLYSQQEALYLALFDEVTEAKSLLEQVALVSKGRTMYSTCLSSIARYVREDLLRGTNSNDGSKEKKPSPSLTPSLLLSARPADDPLEAILYLTSVGIPGNVYDTVRSLRQARARRLGALQRKVPVIHLLMLWILGGIMMASFPVLVGVGDAIAGSGGGLIQKGRQLMTLPGMLFGVGTFALVLTKCVLGELWREKGGAYNVDSVLKVMVRGLEVELEQRMAEAKQIMKRSKDGDSK